MADVAMTWRASARDLLQVRLLSSQLGVSIWHVRRLVEAPVSE